MKMFGQLLLLVGMASAAFGAAQNVPEVDAGTATSAIALVSGAILVLRARKK